MGGMNKDQVKGATKDIAGKIQEETGKLVGSKEQQAKGPGEAGRGQSAATSWQPEGSGQGCGQAITIVRIRSVI